MSLYLGVCYGHIGKSPWQTGLYFRNETLAFPFVLNVWSAACTALFKADSGGGTTYLSLMSTLDGVDNLWVYRIDDTNDRKIDVVRTDQGLGSGIDPSAPLPSHDAAMVLFHPAVRTRSTSRMYLPRIVASETAGGFISPGAGAAIKGWSNSFVASLTTNLCFPVVRDRKRHTEVAVASLTVARFFAVMPSRTDAALPPYF